MNLNIFPINLYKISMKNKLSHIVTIVMLIEVLIAIVLIINMIL